jgi:hypothetical protein
MITLHRAAVSLVLACALTTSMSAFAEGPSADACATASDNAQPLRKTGKFHEAKQQLLICVNKSCPSMVRNDCSTQLNELEKVTPTIVFEAKDAGGNDVTAVTVTMDGAPLADHLDGTALPVDPGRHHFVLKAVGTNPVVTKDLVIRESEKERHEALVFGAATVSAAASNDSSGPPTDVEGGSPKWPIYAAFGVGAVGLIVGTIGLVGMVNQNSTLSGECTLPNGGCDPKYQPQLDQLHQDQIVAGIGFGVAVVGAGIGTYLLLTASSPPAKAQASGQVRVSPRIGIGWLGVGGQFQ